MAEGYRSSGRIIIGVIEDEPSIVDIMRVVLTNEGYQVVSAPTGSRGWHLIRQARPHVVLLDFSRYRPGGGWWILERLLADGSTRQIPVIAMSADTLLLRERANDLKRECFAVLEKPFDLNTLLALVAAAVGSVAPQPEDVWLSSDARNKEVFGQ